MITGIILALKENGFSAETNKTNVTITATITWNSGSYDYVGVPLALKLDGAQVDYKTGVYFNRSQKTSGSEEFYSYTTDIEHNSNGEKTLACELIYHTNLLGGTRTVSASWTLTQIPRASTIAATAADIGAVSVISVNRKNDAFTHTVAYKFGELGGYIQDADGNVGSAATKLTATSIAFTVPESFYNQIPAATSGECSLTCKTYSGTTQIGEEKTCKFRVTTNADECRPVVTGTVVDVNKDTAELTGDENILILNASTVLCTMNVEVKHGATVQTRMIAGRSVEENSLQIEKIDQQEVIFSVTDSRGYTGTCTVKPFAVDYIPLTCNPVAKRKDPTSGAVVLTISGKCYKGLLTEPSIPGPENEVKLSYLADTGDEILQGEIILSDTDIQENGSYSVSVDLTGFDYKKQYTIEVDAEDKIKRLETTAVVQKGVPVFDWGESDFQFNVPVCFVKDEEGNGIPMLDYVTAEGTTDGGWHYRKWMTRKIELWKTVEFTTVMEWVNDGGSGNFIGRYSLTDVSGGEHGFYPINPVEIVTVTGGKGCWLASVGADHELTETDTYRLYSYEAIGQVSVSVNFYIFANDYSVFD